MGIPGKSQQRARVSAALCVGASAMAIAGCGGSKSVIITHTETVANSQTSPGNSGAQGNSGTADTGTGTLETVTATPVVTVTETVAQAQTVTVTGQTGSALSDTPQFTTGSDYTGREPSSIGISQDGGDIVTNLRWTWGAESATGNGTSDVQSCVPNCAQGSDTPVPTTIVLEDPSPQGYFTKLIEYRQNTTSVYNYTPGQSPDNWPTDAS